MSGANTTKSYKQRLPGITTLIFDVDGVFTDGMVTVMPDGQLLRSLSAKDAYALQYAIKRGFRVAIITGSNSMSVAESLRHLGVKHVFLQSSNKLSVYEKFIDDQGISDEEILYMGDDIPDYAVLSRTGVSTCPADAGEEVKRICHYVSRKKGGRGCVRDVIEQTLRAQHKWFGDDALIW
ncbi:MAG: KdsC family phosphatase [Cryomorphaceae bacterium]|nr:HAD hydrolase family protein [Flavobacteriales bacterium]